MELHGLIAVVLGVTALFSWVNARWFRLPHTIGAMAAALAGTLALLALRLAWPGAGTTVLGFVHVIDFRGVVLDWMLGYLLFAGALHVDLGQLVRHSAVIALLSTLGLLISTGVVAVATWGLAQLVGLPLGPLDCLAFGALVSPTDPVAVLGLLRRAGVREDLRAQVAGESLFNDGVGVVVFLVIMRALDGHVPSAGEVGLLLVREALGGALLGALVGYGVYRMLRVVDHHQTELLVTLAAAAGVWTLAARLHVSGAIAAVVCGLALGNYGRALAMSATTREHLDAFWRFVDDVLNAVLFVLIGLEVTTLRLSPASALAAGGAVLVALVGRFCGVAVPVAALRCWRPMPPGTIRTMTWAGLRGGISIALALALPPGPARDVLVAMAYAVVVFSVLVQGLTVGRLARRWARPAHEAGEDAVA